MALQLSIARAGFLAARSFALVLGAGGAQAAPLWTDINNLGEGEWKTLRWNCDSPSCLMYEFSIRSLGNEDDAVKECGENGVPNFDQTSRLINDFTQTTQAEGQRIDKDAGKDSYKRHTLIQQYEESHLFQLRKTGFWYDTGAKWSGSSHPKLAYAGFYQKAKRSKDGKAQIICMRVNESIQKDQEKQAKEIAGGLKSEADKQAMITSLSEKIGDALTDAIKENSERICSAGAVWSDTSKSLCRDESRFKECIQDGILFKNYQKRVLVNTVRSRVELLTEISAKLEKATDFVDGAKKSCPAKMAEYPVHGD